VEAPAYVPDLFRLVGRRLAPNHSFLWGPRFPGIQSFNRHYSLLETCALQWMFSVQSVLMHTWDMSHSRYLEVRFERLIGEPEKTLRQVMAFLDLPHCPAVIDTAKKDVRPEVLVHWRTAISQQEQALLEHWLRPLLDRLGYK
jgi:hypothetical protein